MIYIRGENSSMKPSLMGSERCFREIALLISTIFLLIFRRGTSTMDTITQTRYISDASNGAVVSSNGNFKLGFFSPRNSPNRYVGIWFNKLPQKTVVWVANRDTPLKNTSGVFKITDDGNIAVFYSDDERLPLWSTNVSVAATTNSTAKLLPSGNLVLITTNGTDHPGTVAWQSFDYPTDRVLAGMKFGLDKRTGWNRILTSWKSDDDPAQGEFTLRFENSGEPQIFLYQGSTAIFRVGPWNGRTLSGLPVVHGPPLYIVFSNFSYVNNHDEVYTIFKDPNPSTFATLVVKPLGTVERQIWGVETQDWFTFYSAPQDRCDGYRWCGPSAICNNENTNACSCLPGFNSSVSSSVHCVEKKKAAGTCGKGDGEGFIKLENVKVPDARSCRFLGNLSLEECKMECLKSCNCTGYASSDIVSGRGCFAWYGMLNNTKQYSEDGQDFYIRVDAIELAANMRKKSKGFGGVKRTVVIITVSAALGSILFIFCSYFLWKKHVKSKEMREQQTYRDTLFLDSTNFSNEESQNENSGEKIKNVELTFYDKDTLIAATDNFSPVKKLGEGGYGPVYKGKLSNGQEIAVKRLSSNSGQGHAEFKNEVSLTAKLQHRNLVKLLGCCIENDEKMLVYEYMPNKSLDYFIFDETRKSLLDWTRRYEIIVGIARGILYLHQDSRLRIIHRDLKTSNILLDDELNPKISDLGTARIFGGKQNEANTSKVVGTFGYMSPEYALDGQFSIKSDAFSFGVLLLEIISGKKNMSFFNDRPCSNLIRDVWKLWNEDRALQIIDSSMRDSCPTHEVMRCIQVGLLCVQHNAADRPTMSSVVFMLSNEANIPSPIQPAFYIQRSQLDNTGSTTGSKSPSTNEVTVTGLKAR